MNDDRHRADYPAVDVYDGLPQTWQSGLTPPGEIELTAKLAAGTYVLVGWRRTVARVVAGVFLIAILLSAVVGFIRG